ncbi:hypothetical protein EDD21DRAFT_221573 [Dissophora ornata]|nr:hypothetical protein EDD21DRAFT_221573 [Dissophora ornata]
MKISISVATLCALLLASSTNAFEVCRSDWQDAKTCGYNCMNNDGMDATWCDNFKAAMQNNGAGCWGDCHSNAGAKFWCSKNTMSDPTCGDHYWSTS